MQSFFRYNGFKNPVGASDVVYATSSLLEMFSSSSSSTASGADGGETGDVSTSGARTGGVVSKAEGVQRQAAFNKAYDCLSMQSESLLKEGVLAALSLQRVRSHHTMNITFLMMQINSYLLSSQVIFTSCIPTHFEPLYVRQLTLTYSKILLRTWILILILLFVYFILTTRLLLLALRCR